MVEVSTQSSLQQRLNKQLVRYLELQPGKTAFVDAKSPGSHLKDNFCIIGSGVAESAEQPVHIHDTAGFNIGGAGQPPGIKNSLHSHRSAEIFIIFRGSFRFYWGGNAEHDAVLNYGDLISIPTNLFRGFEVVGRDYGYMFSILGGDNAGGGVIWHPSVILKGREHGLFLTKRGKIVDIEKEEKPAAAQLMPLLSNEDLLSFDNYTPQEMVERFVVLHKNFSTIDAEIAGGDYREYALSGHPESKLSPQVKSVDGVSVVAYEMDEGGQVPSHLRSEKQVLINFDGDVLVKVELAGESAQILLCRGDVLNVEQGSTISLQAVRGKSLTYVVLGDDRPAAVTLP